MFQILIAVLFLSMIATPAILAAKSGKKECEPELVEAEVQTEVLAAGRRPMRRTGATAAQYTPATLPMRGTLGMANR